MKRWRISVCDQTQINGLASSVAADKERGAIIKLASKLSSDIFWLHNCKSSTSFGFL